VPDGDVGRLVLGTAALGLPYGLSDRAAVAPALLPEDEAAAVIRNALEAGIDTFDTAPAYGEAEARLGRSLAGAGRVWTKVGAPVGPSLGGDLQRSVRESRDRLRRDRLELVSWHNWNDSLAAEPAFLEAWDHLRAQPAVAAVGATTYGVRDATAAAQSGLFDVVQVEWNLLRQGVLTRLRQHPTPGAGVAVRSVWLQGTLTPRRRSLPSFLRGLGPSLSRANALAEEWGLDLETLALRAALDQPGLARVVIGVDSCAQLASALQAARGPRLDADQLDALRALDRGEDPLTDPRTWVERAAAAGPPNP
jgi:aryl-alcohol dehydrogenase-like predicted oxidoreductase